MAQILDQHGRPFPCPRKVCLPPPLERNPELPDELEGPVEVDPGAVSVFVVVCCMVALIPVTYALETARKVHEWNSQATTTQLPDDAKSPTKDAVFDRKQDSK